MRRSFLLIALLALVLIAPAALAAPPPQAGDGEEYVVQADDWLSKLALKYYGDMFAYPVIVEATNARAAEDDSFTVIDNPDLIEVGQKLWIPAPQMTTEVIAYVPPVPAETRDGSCWVNFLNSPYSWSCFVGANSIFEPCLTAVDGQTIVCNIDPLNESQQFALNLTEPLPDPEPARPDAPISQEVWLLELADGVICGLFSGTSIGFDDQRVNYGCQDGAQILGDPQPGPVWTAQRITVGQKETTADGEFPFFIETSETARIARVWRPGDPTATPSEAAPAGGDLTIEALKNAAYQGIYAGPVQLADGKYEGKPFVEGGASRPTVTFIDPFFAFGDLNGDGVEDAAVTLAENSGGSGTFIYLAAVVLQDGAPVNVATQLLGDRVQIKSMTVEAGEVVVTLATFAADDPLCCPSLEETRRYRLQEGAFVEQ